MEANCTDECLDFLAQLIAKSMDMHSAQGRTTIRH
jgi:hypothetical protein